MALLRISGLEHSSPILKFARVILATLSYILLLKSTVFAQETIQDCKSSSGKPAALACNFTGEGARFRKAFYDDKPGLAMMAEYETEIRLAGEYYKHYKKQAFKAMRACTCVDPKNYRPGGSGFGYDPEIGPPEPDYDKLKADTIKCLRKEFYRYEKNVSEQRKSIKKLIAFLKERWGVNDKEFDEVLKCYLGKFYADECNQQKRSQLEDPIKSWEEVSMEMWRFIHNSDLIAIGGQKPESGVSPEEAVDQTIDSAAQQLLLEKMRAIKRGQCPDCAVLEWALADMEARVKSHNYLMGPKLGVGCECSVYNACYGDNAAECSDPETSYNPAAVWRYLNGYRLRGRPASEFGDGGAYFAKCGDSAAEKFFSDHPWWSPLPTGTITGIFEADAQKVAESIILDVACQIGFTVVVKVAGPVLRSGKKLIVNKYFRLSAAGVLVPLIAPSTISPAELGDSEDARGSNLEEVQKAAGKYRKPRWDGACK